MAISLVNITSSGVGTSNPSVITVPATGTGNLVVVMVQPELATGDIHITGITDDAGNSYQAVSGALHIDATEGASTDIWYAANSTAGATTVTITYNTTPIAGNLSIVEYSGVKISAPVLDGQNAESTGTASLGPVLTNPDVNGLLVTYIYKHATNPTGVNAPWNALTSPAVLAVDLIAPGSTGTFQAVFTPAQTDLYITSGAVFASAGFTPSSTSAMFLVF